MATDIIARGMITEYKSGTNISFKENDDGSVTISASGDVSSEDTVARETIDNHKLDKNNPHNVTAEQVGLGNVDNTADLDKPISTAIQTALNGKVDKIDVKDNLESTDTISPLSANQGKVLNKKITEHTDDSDIHVTASDKENWNSHLTDISVSGNPVQLDGLQGGVPFSEIVVSGKNLIPYPYDRTSGVYNGLTVDISDDGKFSINGTATADTTIFVFAKQNNPIYLSGGVSYTLNCSQQYNIDSFNLFFKVYHADKTYSGYTKYPASFTAKNGDYLIGSLWIKSGSVVNVENVEIQLEIGDTATEYEPPITGRELTLNINGTEIAVTPDSNPYTVPDDIRQQDGLNTVSVSAGELTVIGNKINPQFRKTVDMLDGKSDLSHKHTKSDITDFPASLPANGGNADTATKLASAHTIDGVSFNGTGGVIHYATCSTEAATAAKTVSLTGFTLATGAKIAVKFTVTNTAANPTLNVNSTGAKSIYYRGAAIGAGYLAANRTYEFVYNGTQYELVGDLDTNTTYKVATTSADGLMSLGDKKILDTLKTPYATCATGRATAAKVATLANFTLTVGATIAVKFTDTAGTTMPSSGNLTLNVNNTGAKDIASFRNGIKTSLPANIVGDFFYNNITHIFTYDGTYWLCMDWNADNNTDEKVKNELKTTTKAYVTGTTSATTNTGTQVFDTGVYLDTTAGQLVANTFKGDLSGTAENAIKIETFDVSGNPYTGEDKENNKVYVQWDGVKYLKLSNDYNKTAADYAASAGIVGVVNYPSSGTTGSVVLGFKPSCVIAVSQSFTNSSAGQKSFAVMITGNTAQTLYHPDGSVIISLTDTGFSANFNSGKVSMFRYIAFK